MNKRQKIVQQTFLNDEEKVIKRLKSVYNQSLKDITTKSNTLQKDIEKLAAMYESVEDEAEKARLQSMVRSKVYQKQYQDGLKKQVSDILDNMHENEYKTVSAYLKKCYEQGFLGAMYDLQGQGIPFCFPLDQEAMVRAVQLDSKISHGLYTRLGEDISLLKKKITAQVSRGISTGMTFEQVAQQLAGVTNIGFNNAVRIARTEGHRIQCQSGMDACYKAKDKGADVVKQWDSTLDSATRESHVAVDGEIKELDEKFSNGLMFPGDPSGGAAEVVNCRCALLQRARWALTEKVNPDTGEVYWEDGSFTKMDNFTKQIKTFESPEDYAEFKKAFFSKENRQYMNYYQQLEEKYQTKDFAALLGSMDDKEYKHFTDLATKNPALNADKKSKTPNTPIHNTVEVSECTDFSSIDKYLQKVYNISMDSSVMGLDFDSVKEGIDGIERVLKEFPQAQVTLKKITTGNSGIMCATFGGDIEFNSSIFNDRSVVLKKHPQTSYYIKGNNVVASGAHEAGHMLERTLIEKDTNLSMLFMKKSAWSDCTKAKEVVSEACKAAKKTAEGKGKLNSTLKREISGYALDDASECMAEAVSDVVVNGQNAAVLSKEIWKILKKELG